MKQRDLIKLEKLQKIRNTDFLVCTKIISKFLRKKSTKEMSVFASENLRHLSAFIPFIYLTCGTRYLRAEGPSLMRPFDPKIAEEVGTKVCAQKYRLCNGHKILRGDAELETLELAIRFRFIRHRGRFK